MLDFEHTIKNHWIDGPGTTPVQGSDEGFGGRIPFSPFIAQTDRTLSDLGLIVTRV